MSLPKTFLAIGIAIILAVFISYGLHVIYESPTNPYQTSNCYETYNCNQYGYGSQAYISCKELSDKCSEEYEKQTPRYQHAKNSFFILVILGIISIVLGMSLVELEGIGSGLIGGGILITLWSLVYTWQYWFTLNKYLKLFVLGVVLVTLIYLGYKKIESKISK